MEHFDEIEGAVLEDISTSEATYVDAGDKNEPLKIKGYSLAFDLGQFVIENPFAVVSPENENTELNQLVGLKVIKAYSNEEEIRIIFESGTYISVSMKDKDFVGPEAASYSPKRGNIIVFN
ncbi:MAG TPA: hypothetical protein ENJ28_05720 [Gammaproteobacteria bacterium]|nr:hypothetical protein [Gammaproteobacteria bacterium]